MKIGKIMTSLIASYHFISSSILVKIFKNLRDHFRVNLHLEALIIVLTKPKITQSIILGFAILFFNLKIEKL